MNTNEGNHIRVPTPNGQLELPLDNGLRTAAGWLTADVAFDLASGWRLQNASQAMQNSQQWNATVPSDVMPAADFVTRLLDQGVWGIPPGPGSPTRTPTDWTRQEGPKRSARLTGWSHRAASGTSRSPDR
jgi:hypothetical protein